MPLVNDLEYKDAPPDALEYKNAPVDQIMWRDTIIYSRVDRPHLTAFIAAPTFGRSEAPTAGSVVNLSWDVTGTVASQVLEWRDAEALNTDPWTAIPIAGPGNNAVTPWRESDTDYRITCTDAVGESTSKSLRWYRTIAPRFITPLSVTAQHTPIPGLGDALRLTATWAVTASPRWTLAWSGAPSDVHLNNPNRATTSDGRGSTFWEHILTTQGETFDLVLTCTNPVSGESVTSTFTVRIPPLGAG